MFRRNNIQLFVCVISLVVVCALSNPMYYKKNGNDKYEPAAHCIQGKGIQERVLQGYIKVLLGAYNLTSKTELGVQQRDVQEIYVHPKWDAYSEQYDSDLAILLLNENFLFTDYIRPVSFSVDDFEMDKVKGIAVGWGLTEIETKLNTECIMRAYVEVLNGYYCLTQYPEVAVISSLRTFCGEAEEGNVNRGDSGGGFYVQNKEFVWVQRGIFSSSGYVDSNSVVVYTDVAKFKNWIADTVLQSIDKMEEDDTSIKVHLECIFAYEAISHRYTCILDDLDILRENVTVGYFSGVHLSGRTDDDVEVIIFRSGTMYFIPSGIGKIFINVKRIVIGENLRLKRIKRSDFKNLKNLVHLKILKNEISKMDQDTFRDLQVLEVFSIIGNGLIEIEEGTFETNVKLKEVSLHENKLLALPRRLFQNNLLLERVSVFNNSLKTIHEFTFETNIKLTNIHLAMNNIEVLPRLLLLNNPLLEFVNLRYNSLRINETDFTSLKNIKKIFLHKNICIDAYYEDQILTEFQNLIRANCSSPDP